LLLKFATLGRLNAVCRALLSTGLNVDFLEKLVNAGSLKELSLFLRESSYAPFVEGDSKESLLKAVDDYFLSLIRKLAGIYSVGMLEEFFLAEDRGDFLLKMLESEELKDFALIYSDFLDIVTLVRFRLIEGLPPENVSPFLIARGKLRQFLVGLLESSNLEEFSSKLPFARNSRSLGEFRKELYRFHVVSLRKLLLGMPFRPAVSFVVLRLKEVEKMNLIAVIEGLAGNFDKEQIEEMIIDTS